MGDVGMTDPFLWVSRRAADAISRLDTPSDRKLARLLVWALAEMASESFDGKHEGFDATVGDVRHRMDVSETTFRKARDLVVALGLVDIVGRTDRRGKRLSSRWVLLPATGEPPRAAAPRPEGDQLVMDLTSSVEGAYARAGEGLKKKNESPTDSVPGVAETLTLEVVDGPTDPVAAVIDHWVAVTPGRQGARSTEKRRKVVGARLKRFTADQLKAVVEHKARDPFLNGENPGQKLHNDLDVSFRNDEKVETALAEIEMAAKPSTAVARPAPSNAREAQAAAKNDRVAKRRAAMDAMMGKRSQA